MALRAAAQSRRPWPSRRSWPVAAVLAVSAVSVAAAQAPFVYREGVVPVENHAGAPPKRSIAEMVGSGVCVLDYDLDGLPDLYFTDGGDAAAALAERSPSASSPGNRLFRNRGGLDFVEVGTAAGVGDRGYSGGCAAADFDNDGDPDLLVVNLGPNAFFENLGDGTFRRRDDEFGLTDPGFGTGAAFGDLDDDGWLDLYVANYVDRRRADLSGRCSYFGLAVFCGPNGLPGEADRLYRNAGGRGFRDVTTTSGVHAPETRGFSVLLTDLDADGLPDIHVANDATRDLVFHNLGSMQFAEVSLLSGAAYAASGKEQSGMGSATGDFDGDGALDLYVTNFQRDYNTLFRNTSSVTGSGLWFEDDTVAAGLNLTTLDFLGWAALPLDADHDGDLDLFVANGHIYPELRERPEIGEPYEQANQFFRNDGSGRFATELVAGPLRSSRGAAFADLDGDGDSDIIVTNIDAPVDTLLAAAAPPAVRLRFVGTESNRDGLNARVHATGSAGRATVRELRASDGFLGSNELVITLGLGEAPRFSEIQVRWPSGAKTVLLDVRGGQILIKEEVGPVH